MRAMTEWWSYRLSDFLMFSPPVYWRLFESLNQDGWPLPVVLLLAFAVVAGVWWWRTPQRVGPPLARAAACVLAVAWLWVAWAFFWQRFAPINWAAQGFAWLFAAQALGWLLLAASPGLRWAARSRAMVMGGLLGAWALLGHPGLAWVFGRPLAQAEWWGLAPDPTALGSLAFLLLIEGGERSSRLFIRALWLLPLLWCTITTLTLWTMGEAQAAVVLALTLWALAAATGRLRQGHPRHLV
jgi:hypothetical protein